MLSQNIPHVFKNTFYSLLLASSSCLAQPQTPTSDIEEARKALLAAQTGTLDLAHVNDYQHNILYNWITFAVLTHDITTLDPQPAHTFLTTYGDQPVASAFRVLWLNELARRHTWDVFLAEWKEPNTPPSLQLRCAYLVAKDASGHPDKQWVMQAQKLWTETPANAPSACQALELSLQNRHAITPKLQWERLDQAAAAMQIDTVRSVALSLPASQQKIANTYADFLSQPGVELAQQFPMTLRSREIAVDGLKALAKEDPNAAETVFESVTPKLRLSPTQQNAVLYQIALWSAASYLPNSTERLARVPEASYDDTLYMWRVRDAILHADWQAALSGVQKMPADLQNTTRWQYIKARMLEKNGHEDEAKILLKNIASSTTFYGFLAADALSQPYTLCPAEPKQDADMTRQIAEHPAIVRALALFQVKQPTWANLEWNSALANMDPVQKITAAKIAFDAGWYNQTISTLGQSPTFTTYYRLRFPTPYNDIISQLAERFSIDPSWIYAEIRGESAFKTDAVSSANALGLMQLLPSTAAKEAQTIGLQSYQGSASLFDPQINMTLGSSHLRTLLNTYKQPFIAIAAYNAGSPAVERWLRTLSSANTDPDLWIETLNFGETRDYVSRILAFSVIYDWTMQRPAISLSARMRGIYNGPTQSFKCP